MLLLHQVGSLKTGEVVRYTITYIPSQDRILPSPEKLHLRVRNTSAIALRAAFVHGPYTLCAAAYPAGYNPNEKFEYPERYGVPEFEPMVKAGGSWECELVVPVTIRQSAGLGSHGGFGKGPSHDHESASWIVEVSSQILFSTSAAVGFEVLLARDKKSLSLGNSSAVINGQAQVAQPGKISDHQQGVGAKDGHHPAQPKGVFSRAIQVKVEDTATLWNTPRLPGWDDQGDPEKREGPDQHVESVSKTGDPEAKDDSSEPQKPKQKQKKVHMVVLTHGLHSNLGADMLFMKESIDATVKQAKIDAKARRARERAERKESENGLAQSDSYNTKDQDRVEGEDDESDDDEEVIVRGYSGNSTKTERGIKYLGKRLARYVLSMTYPDQPFLPTGKGMAETLTHTFDKHDPQQKAVHAHSSIHLGKDGAHLRQAERPYKITSISFIAHSLGGLVQTYAIAYIQKHSPQFFDLIKPINFVALATPFLGLSNENPLYVKFALDSGLVGRTGKDLGLTWRAPTIARSGWGAIVGNLGETAHKKVYGDSQPESKPLLRILPTGPAHTALKKFRNRTVYSNVVNDGIVPLRTSCLLFLDWQGLGRVEKARRDAGLVETVVGFGWSELTGTAQGNARQRQIMSGERSAGQSGTSSPRDTHENMREVPQPPSSVMVDDDRASLRSVTTPYGDEAPSDSADSGNADSSASGPLSGFFNFFKSNEPPKPQNVSPKQKRIFSNSQTLKGQVDGQGNESAESDSSKPPKVTTGHEHEDEVSAPPRTTVFESASDLLNPKVPDVEYLIDPSKRPRTIFHDRIYHPSDIPGPPLKKRPSTLVRRNTGQRQNSIGQASTSSTGSSPYPSVNREDSSLSSKDYDDTAHTNPDKDAHEVIDTSNMRVEEKIARAYHKDLSWRKVLVKVEPDAHNNVFVRRMFANAYGWPVMKHLVDAHFSDSVTARLRMEDEDNKERARNMNEPPDAHGAELKKSRDNLANMTRTDSESREALDKVSDLPKAARSKRNSDSSTHQRPKVERADSVNWSDRDWHDSDNDSDLDFGGEPPAPTTPSALSPQDKGKEAQGSSGAGGWNWAEKIVGKGASRAKSPVHDSGGS